MHIPGLLLQVLPHLVDRLSRATWLCGPYYVMSEIGFHGERWYCYLEAAWGRPSFTILEEIPISFGSAFAQ